MIFFLPFGDIDLYYIDKVKTYVQEVYKEEVIIMEEVPFPENCIDIERKQYNAVCVMDFLPDIEGGEIVGICDKDLYVDGLNFVFGIAENIGNKKCVVSINRLKPSFYGKNKENDLTTLRTAKEVIHELGHLKGLKHCGDRKCVMHFSNSIYDTDFKDYKLCKNCKRRIFK